MSSSSRDKGARGEREVAALFTGRGLPLRRVPNSGGLDVKGDLVGLDGFHFEVKRQEVLRLPLWLRQAAADAGELSPVVVFRQNRGGWYAVLELDDLIDLLADRAGSL